MAQIDSPAAERTGWWPGRIARASTRVSTTTSSMSAPKPARAASGSQGSADRTAAEKVPVPCTAGSSTAAPLSIATTGSAAITSESAAKASSHSGRRGGASSDHGPRAVAWCSAGEPDQNSPAGTSPSTAEPGPTSASRPIVAPGSSRLRAPIRARLPIRISPICSRSPSIQ